MTTVPRFGVGDGTGRRKCIVGGYAPLGVITLFGYYKQHNTKFFSLLLSFCGELKGNDYESNSERKCNLSLASNERFNKRTMNNR